MPIAVGAPYEFTLDGAPLECPRVIEPHVINAHALSETATRPKVDGFWYGDGLPDVNDRFEWVLVFDIRKADAALKRRLAILRTKGREMPFCDWMQQCYTFTARSGQQYFYLPRGDAYSKQYAGHTASAWKPTITINGGAALTVVHKTTVLAGDVVPSGEVWISNTTMKHVYGGITVAPFKIGTPLVVGDEVLVEYWPVYQVRVIDVPTQPFEQILHEDKSLYLAEVA